MQPSRRSAASCSWVSTPFGDDAHVESASEREDGVDDRLVGAVERHVAHEALIDLQHVDGEVAHEAQRRRTGAEVVERDREAGRARRGETLGRGVDVVEHLLFGDLDAEVVHRAVVLGEELLQPLEPFDAQSRTDDVDPDPEVVGDEAAIAQRRCARCIASTKIPWSIGVEQLLVDARSARNAPAVRTPRSGAASATSASAPMTAPLSMSISGWKYATISPPVDGGVQFGRRGRGLVDLGAQRRVEDHDVAPGRSLGAVLRGVGFLQQRRTRRAAPCCVEATPMLSSMSTSWLHRRPRAA